MNAGEVIVCNGEEGCGEPFEVLREYYHDGVTCPYCGEPCGPGVNDL
jgi:hypothetical protein